MGLPNLFNDLDLIFANDHGRPIDPDNLVKREFVPALTRAGLQKIRFHDLRHSFATLLIHQGENVKYVSAQLGHASTQITVDRYGHLLPEVHNGAGERLEETVFGNSSISKMRNISLYNINLKSKKTLWPGPFYRSGDRI